MKGLADIASAYGELPRQRTVRERLKSQELQMQERGDANALFGRPDPDVRDWQARELPVSYKPSSVAKQNKPLPEEVEARKKMVLDILIEKQLAKLSTGRPATGAPPVSQPMGDVPVPIQDIGTERPRY